MTGIRIAVQPPSRSQVSTILYPPLVAELTFRGSVPGYYFFAMAYLLTRNGDLIEGGLQGTTTVTGIDLTAMIGSSRTTIYFSFLDLSIPYEGAYKIRVDVYKVAYEDTDSYTFQEQTKTNRITVVNEAVPATGAGSAERSVIRNLQAAGVPIS